MGQSVVKTDQHASRDIKKLAVDLEDLGGGCEVLLQAVGGGTEQHQRTAHANDVLLTLENVCNVNFNANVLILFGLNDFGQYAAAATSALVV